MIDEARKWRTSVSLVLFFFFKFALTYLFVYMFCNVEKRENNHAVKDSKRVLQFGENQPEEVTGG